MRNRLIYICSPLRGDIEKNIQKAQGYCREAVAVDNVKSYLVEALADIPNREQITIIA